MKALAVSYSAIAENAIKIKEALGDFYCVVKSDAYGHGVKKTVFALREAGFDAFAVFSLEEALEIKDSAAGAEILILGKTPARDIETIKENGFIQTVFSEDYLKEILPFSMGLSVHVKIDTGMHRTGFVCEADEIMSAFSGFRGEISGVYTHFHAADCKDSSYTEKQLGIFERKADGLEALLGKRLKKHAAASAAALRFPKARLDASRIGLALYGILPDNCDVPFNLTPAMSLFGEITAIKKVRKGENVGYGCDHLLKSDSMIATVALGYGMGVPRCIEKSFSPCVKGVRVPFASRICMDRFMLDVTELFESGAGVKAGEYAELFGKNISVNEFAICEGTIPYETLCRVGKMNLK